MKEAYFWHVTIRCAQCGGVQPTDQPGSLPADWIGIIVNERKAAIARTPAEAVREQPQYESKPYPVCGASCGAKLLIAQAFAMTRTKAEQGVLAEQLKDALTDAAGGVTPLKPN